MIQRLAIVKVNDNQLILSKKGGKYCIQIGHEDDVVMRYKPLKTPGGRRVTEKNAYKYFLQAVEAAKSLKLNSTT
jgi:hypothetical protein